MGYVGRRDCGFASEWVVDAREIGRKNSEHGVRCIKAHLVGKVGMEAASFVERKVHHRVDSERIFITCNLVSYQRYLVYRH